MERTSKTAYIRVATLSAKGPHNAKLVAKWLRKARALEKNGK